MRNWLLSIVLVMLTSGVAYSSQTEWQQHQDMLQTRLVVTSLEPSEDGKLMLAWEAKLAPGWKTYWRSPGEAGLPVRVFAGGMEQEVLYPYPERFELFGLETYGYSKYVVLPFEVAFEDRSKLHIVDVDFMVCKEICVPFRSSYNLENVPFEGPSIHDQKVKKWLARVPEKSGDDGVGLEITAVKVVGKVGHQKIIVDAKANNSLSNADILAEVNDMFHFGKPKMKLLADGRSARFVLPAMTGKKPEDLRQLKVRLTFTDGHGASIDRTIDLSS